MGPAGRLTREVRARRLRLARWLVRGCGVEIVRARAKQPADWPKEKLSGEALARGVEALWRNSSHEVEEHLFGSYEEMVEKIYHAVHSAIHNGA